MRCRISVSKPSNRRWWAIFQSRCNYLASFVISQSFMLLLRADIALTCEYQMQYNLKRIKFLRALWAQCAHAGLRSAEPTIQPTNQPYGEQIYMQIIVTKLWEFSSTLSNMSSHQAYVFSFHDFFFQIQMFFIYV